MSKPDLSKIKFKEVKLRMSEAVFNELNQQMIAGHLTGSLYGIKDEFVQKVLKGLAAKEGVVDLFLKKEVQDGKEKEDD